MKPLRPGANRLDPDQIKANLTTKLIGRKVLVYSRTSSTNDVAAEYARNPANDGMAIFAEEQTAGRGRGGNRWMAAYGESLLCSIILLDCGLSPELLPLTCAVAAAETIGGAAKIKWPNDVFVNGRKIAGILLEAKSTAGGTTRLVGVGINCHQGRDSFGPGLGTSATSIDIENGSFCDRTSLARRLLTSLDHWLDVAEEVPEQVTSRWCDLSTQLGNHIAVSYRGRKFAGHCVGIDPEKGLVLRLDSGGTRMFEAAHSTIVG